MVQESLFPFCGGLGQLAFLSEATMRSGQQAALGSDLLALLDALKIETAILGGYDWGGLASCVVAALWSARVAGLVSLASYDILDLCRQREPCPPELEHALWYQHLFQTGRGRAGLAK
jgi:pimeloyl-ACP methyl ester carboxylesterase